MRVVGEHPLGHMPCNGHHSPVTCLGFCQLRDRVVSQIVETQTASRALHLAQIRTT